MSITQQSMREDFKFLTNAVKEMKQVVQCLAQRHNTVVGPGIDLTTCGLRSGHANHSTTAPPRTNLTCQKSAGGGNGLFFCIKEYTRLGSDKFQASLDWQLRLLQGYQDCLSLKRHDI